MKKYSHWYVVAAKAGEEWCDISKSSTIKGARKIISEHKKSRKKTFKELGYTYTEASYRIFIAELTYSVWE